MTACTDDERRRVAAELRGLNGNVSHVRRVYEDEGSSILCDDQADYYQICHAVAGYLPAEHMHPCDYEELHARLADLIEPSCDPTERGIDSIYDWCFAAIEGADGPEDELYCSIMSAIEEYRHPERITARTARPVDREALLALASSMCRRHSWISASDAERAKAIARRIRELCGKAVV